MLHFSGSSIWWVRNGSGGPAKRGQGRAHAGIVSLAAGRYCATRFEGNVDLTFVIPPVQESDSQNFIGFKFVALCTASCIHVREQCWSHSSQPWLTTSEQEQTYPQLPQCHDLELPL